MRSCLSFFVLLAALGCEPRIELELVDIDAVEPARIDAGHRLAVTGQRFLMGHACTFVLRGLWYRPGEAPERRERSIAGEAISSERAEAIVGEDVLRELGGRATFTGEIEVRFEAASIPGGSVHGVLSDATIDFVPAAHGSLGGELEAIERSLGAQFAEATDEAGVELAALDDDGMLASLGLAVGDRIVGRGGLHVLVPTDLALGGVPATERRLSVTRGAGEPFEVRLPTADAPPATNARIWQLAALLALLGLVGALATRERPRATAPKLAGPAHVVLTVAVALGLWRAMALGWIVDASSLVGAGSLLVALAAAADRSAGSAVLGIVRALALTALFLSAVAVAGTSDLAVLAEARTDPRTWLGLGTPLGPPALFALVVLSFPTGRSPLVTLLDALALGVTCALAAAILFGGVGEHGAGVASLAVRAVAVLAVVGVLRASARPPRSVEIGLAATAIALAPLGAALTLGFELAPESASILAETVAIAAVVSVAVLGAARLRPAPDPRDPLAL